MKWKVDYILLIDPFIRLSIGVYERERRAKVKYYCLYFQDKDVVDDLSFPFHSVFWVLDVTSVGNGVLFYTQNFLLLSFSS